jgi:hypothetical protein
MRSQDFLESAPAKTTRYLPEVPTVRFLLGILLKSSLNGDRSICFSLHILDLILQFSSCREKSFMLLHSISANKKLFRWLHAVGWKCMVRHVQSKICEIVTWQLHYIEIIEMKTSIWDIKVCKIWRASGAVFLWNPFLGHGNNTTNISRSHEICTLECNWMVTLRQHDAQGPAVTPPFTLCMAFPYRWFRCEFTMMLALVTKIQNL